MVGFQRKKTIYWDREAKKFKDHEWTWKALVKAMKDRLDIEKDVLIFVTGRTGCITGDTLIKVSRQKETKTYKMKNLYEKANGLIKYAGKRPSFNTSYPMYVRSFNGTEIRLHKIKEVLYSGKKEVFELKLKNGHKIKATADHRIMTREGWKELQHLTDGDLIMCDTPNAEKSFRKTIKLRDIGLNVGKNHPYNIQPNKQIPVHILIYEAYENGFTLVEYLDILLNEPERCKSLNFINPKEFVIHHKDGNHYNNNKDNLEKLKPSEHKLEHNNYSNFSQGVPKFGEWESTNYVGVEDTYDISCEEPYHNFVANNIVIHNSGKSTFIAQLCLKYFAKEDNIVVKDGGKMFDKENFITNAEELSVKMITNSGKVLWVDEGRSAVSRRNWFDKMNKTIINRKNTNRKLRNVIFLLLPFEREIDPQMMSHATAWFYCKRGVVEIYCASPDFKGSKGLDIQAILDRDEKYRGENPSSRLVFPMIHPEFIGRVYFNKLTAGYKEQYDKLVEENKAVGELSEEEKLKFGLIEDVTPETKIKEMVEMVKGGKLDDKKEMWNTLKKETNLTDAKLLKQINFYLKLEDMPTFSKLFG